MESLEYPVGWLLNEGHDSEEDCELLDEMEERFCYTLTEKGRRYLERLNEACSEK